MKKLLSLLLVAFCLTSASCSDKLVTESDGKSTQTTTQNQLAASEDKKNKTDEQKALQNESKESNDAKTQKNEPTKAEPTQTTQVPKAQIQRTVDLSNGISEDGLLFSGSYDFDYDGKAEKISMDVYLAPGDDWNGSYITINMGIYSCKLEMVGGCIEAVYACDIDPDDGTEDLAIITCEVSGDPRIRIIKYNKEMQLYSFYNDFSDEITDDHWLGYAVNYYFNVNNDGTITLEEQTNSPGMWSIYRTYKRDDMGVFREVKQESYDILPDFMENNYRIDPSARNAITGNELYMWKKGYIKAYTTYTDNGFTIYAGEYFKPLKDNDNNKLYVEKEDGSAAWINIEYSKFDGLHMNEAFFFMAG